MFSLALCAMFNMLCRLGSHIIYWANWLKFLGRNLTLPVSTMGWVVCLVSYTAGITPVFDQNLTLYNTVADLMVDPLGRLNLYADTPSGTNAYLCAYTGL